MKVAIFLEELGIPYEMKNVEDVKGEPFTKLNPNGRYGLLVALSSSGSHS